MWRGRGRIGLSVGDGAHELVVVGRLLRLGGRHGPVGLLGELFQNSFSSGQMRRDLFEEDDHTVEFDFVEGAGGEIEDETLADDEDADVDGEGEDGGEGGRFSAGGDSAPKTTKRGVMAREG